MFRSSTVVLLAVLSVTASSAFAQRTATPASDATSGVAIAPAKPPLFFREDWSANRAPRGCFNLHDPMCEPALTQANVSTPDLELLLYGAGKKRMENGLLLGAVLIQGTNLFT